MKLIYDNHKTKEINVTGIQFITKLIIYSDFIVTVFTGYEDGCEEEKIYIGFAVNENDGLSLKDCKVYSAGEESIRILHEKGFMKYGRMEFNILIVAISGNIFRLEFIDSSQLGKVIKKKMTLHLPLDMPDDEEPF